MAHQTGTEGTRRKPCLCQIKPLVGALYAATGKVNSEGQSEFRCRICGRAEWR